MYIKIGLGGWNNSGLKRVQFMLSAVLLLVYASTSGSQTYDDGDVFPDDPEDEIRKINEGELTFLEKPPEKPVHHHHNTLIVLPESIKSGWVKLVQCHENLDKFPSAQIVYNENKVRNIKLTVKRNIGHAWVEGPSVQLTNVMENARVCIEAESRALHALSDGTYMIQNGPFMRKFLDGYFPMRVSMDIKLPPELRFEGIEPAEQKGFRVVKNAQGLHFDAWFEGKLVTRIKLKLQSEPE